MSDLPRNPCLEVTFIAVAGSYSQNHVHNIIDFQFIGYCKTLIESICCYIDLGPSIFVNNNLLLFHAESGTWHSCREQEV